MKSSKTELVFILDRSGSMSGLENDTIGGFNSMLKKQKAEEGEAVVTTILFDDRYELLHDRKNLQEINPITEDEYFVRGTTALLDALGNTINKITNVQKHTTDSKVLFVIITDGLENASKEYTKAKVKNMVENKIKKSKWEFIFLGANIDAIATARDYGISSKNAVNYHADSLGTKVCYSAVSNVVSNLRAKKKINIDWKKDVEHDYSSRK